MPDSLPSAAIHEALFDQDAFAALPEQLARAGGGRSAILHWRHRDEAHEVLAYSHYPSQFMADYARDYWSRDPWMEIARQPPAVNTMILLDRHVSPEAFEASPVNREFLRPWGDDTFHCVGAVFQSPWGSGVVSVQRGRRAGAFDEADAARLNASARDLRHLLRIRGELAAHRHGAQLAREALDGLGLCAFVTRADGGVIRANPAAEAVIARADGLTIRAGRLGCAETRSARRLADAIEAATAAREPAGSAVRVQRTGTSAYLVTVSPMVGETGRARAVLIFRDPDADGAALADRLRSLFGLTRMEAAVAKDIGAGLSPPRIAANRGLRVSTVRSHLAALAAKTGLHRQSEIAALVASLTPTGPWPPTTV
jgi:DNA-binding CsgD family transcriptional regulator/PAS domain-containing protein